MVIHFTHLRPYHLARFKSAEDAFSGTGIEVQGLALVDACGDLPADLPIARPSRAPLILFANQEPGRLEAWCSTILAMDKLRPRAVAICGYATPDALACLWWCHRNDAKAILMTETREQDGPRPCWKEWVKSKIVRRFNGALCGGSEARAYLEKLGMPANRIKEGYDVVDNDYFANEAQRHRNTDPPVAPYFLGSGRFIPRKNYGFLIEAYAAYVRQSPISSPQSAIWNLCLLGDGELREQLIALCHHLDLNVIESAPWESSPTSDSSFQFSGPSVSASSSATVFFPGWRSHAELPRFYAHAGAFVHPAISEPWGLVVNEAMAAGLRILISNNTGASTIPTLCSDYGQLLDIATLESASLQLSNFVTRFENSGNTDSHLLPPRLINPATTPAFGEGLGDLLNVLRKGAAL
ncbi:glycosyltransferase [Luteolibacter marinus]|uniref:glycosyltransferase n=1 Tax=Luteolibacter marinus TaxID=2776705 RepID=UPI0018682CEC|nr:glycosyltransferase [Luteolibacter marinus]